MSPPSASRSGRASAASASASRRSRRRLTSSASTRSGPAPPAGHPRPCAEDRRGGGDRRLAAALAQHDGADVGQVVERDGVGVGVDLRAVAGHQRGRLALLRRRDSARPAGRPAGLRRASCQSTRWRDHAASPAARRSPGQGSAVAGGRAASDLAGLVRWPANASAISATCPVNRLSSSMGDDPSAREFLAVCAACEQSFAWHYTAMPDELPNNAFIILL